MVDCVAEAREACTNFWPFPENGGGTHGGSYEACEVSFEAHQGDCGASAPALARANLVCHCRGFANEIVQLPAPARVGPSPMASQPHSAHDGKPVVAGLTAVHDI